MENPVVITSMGRSGSTVLFYSIEGSLRSHSGFYRTLSDCGYRFGRVYKTHGYPPENYSNDPLFIWTFSDPFEIILSLKRRAEINLGWTKGHFENMGGVSYEDCENLFKEDCLALEEQFKKWHKEQSFPLVTVKYRAIWKNERKIEEFLQREVNLPPFSPRKKRFPKLSEKNRQEIKNTYKSLREKWKEVPDFKQWPIL